MPFFRERVVAAGSGGTTDRLEWKAPARERRYVVTRYAFEDETTSPSGRLRFGVSGHGYDHWLGEEQIVESGRLYWDEEDVELDELEMLVAEVTGATTADRLVLYVTGYWEPLDA